MFVINVKTTVQLALAVLVLGTGASTFFFQTLAEAQEAGAQKNTDKADDRAALGAVITRAIKVAGGEDKLKKLQTITINATGKVWLPFGGDKERDITFTASVQGLDQCRWEPVTLFGRENAVIGVFNRKYKNTDGYFDGPATDIKKGATHFPGAGFDQDLYAIRLAQLLTPLQDKAFELKPLGEVKVGEGATTGIKFTQNDRPDLDLYFDKEMGLPIKGRMEVSVRVNAVLQTVTDEFTFADYKESDGLKHFTKLILLREGKKRLEVDLSDLTPRKSFDEKIFELP